MLLMGFARIEEALLLYTRGFLLSIIIAERQVASANIGD